MHSPGGPSSFLNSLIETCQESSTTWSPNQCCTFEVFWQQCLTSRDQILFQLSVVVQSLSYARLFVTQRTVACQASQSFAISWSLLKLTSNELMSHPTISSSVIPFSSCPQFFPALVSYPVSQLCIRWPKYWSFSFSINPSNGYSGLISFRIDWFHFLAVQGTLKSLLQHHNSKASILWHSAFFMVQLSYLYMTSGKKKKHIDLTQQTLQWPQDWKRPVFIPIPGRTTPRNVQTTVLLAHFTC